MGISCCLIRELKQLKPSRRRSSMSKMSMSKIQTRPSLLRKIAFFGAILRFENLGLVWSATLSRHSNRCEG